MRKNKQDSYSFSKMFEDVAAEYDPERWLLKKDILYGALSLQAHGLASPMNSIIKNGVQRFRDFENPQYAAWLLNVVRTLAQLIFLVLRREYPNFNWISDEELIVLGKDIDEVILEWKDKFSKVDC